MMWRKVLAAIVIAFAVFYAITNPLDAASFIRTIASGIGVFATAVVTGGRS